MLSNKYQRRIEKYILGGRQKMTLESILLSIKIRVPKAIALF